MKGGPVRLLEWQGREIFERNGIPVPPGELVAGPEEARRAAERLGRPVVIKAQVPIGGRGKAGAIKKAASPEEAGRIAQGLLAAQFGGMRPRSLLVVRAVEVLSEHYLGVTVDRGRRAAVFIYSPAGGVDIEEVARARPGQVAREPVPPLEGLYPFRLRRLFSIAPTHLRRPLMEVAQRLFQVFLTYEASLVEINPLAETPEGLLALDAKVIIDDDHRPGEQFAGLEEAAQDPLEAEAKRAGLSYVGLSGEVGIIGNGAGLVMATLDLVAQAGGRPANFLDIGGGARADRVKKAVEIVARAPGVRVLFVNVFGGITRCDEVAKGIAEGAKGGSLPVVVRLTGTNEREGQELLARAGLVPVGTMEEGAVRAVALAKGGR
ncbi:MAG: Succinyl-CoA ligase [ADP-forming] subunit beta [Acetothermia bacterium 64_32]|nr:MAG: Succinyl-CoA ligase [ADP-forming] subunit beta [Acetothermia bacterium 64_32]